MLHLYLQDTKRLDSQGRSICNLGVHVCLSSLGQTHLDLTQHQEVEGVEVAEMEEDKMVMEEMGEKESVVAEMEEGMGKGMLGEEKVVEMEVVEELVGTDFALGSYWSTILVVA